MSNQLLS